MRAADHSDQLVAAWHGHDETTMRRTYSHTTVDDLRTVLGDQNVTSQAVK